MLFGTQSSLITCPLCKGNREVEDKDQDVLMRHPYRVQKLVSDAVKRAAQENGRDGAGSV